MTCAGVDFDSGEVARTVASAYRTRGSTLGCDSAELLRFEIDRVVKEINETFAVVNHTGKLMVVRECYDVSYKRHALEWMTFDDFKKLHQHRVLAVPREGRAPFRQSVGSLWLSHPNRRQYENGVVFSPGADVPNGYLNLWKGWGVTPKKGSWTLIKRHLRDVICNDDEELFFYLLGWLARMFQKPSEQGQVCLILQGGRGTGKSTILNLLLKIVGQASMNIINSRQLVGNFNFHIADKLLITASEALFSGDRSIEGPLKALITDPEIVVEAKYQNPTRAVNCLKLILASNEENVAAMGVDERRFCVFRVSERYAQDELYFAKLLEEINGDEGPSAMLFDLLEYDISGFSVFRVPQTAALSDHKLQNLRGPEAWLFDCLYSGKICRGGFSLTNSDGTDAQIWARGPVTVSVSSAYDEYVEFSKNWREYRPVDRRKFGERVRRFLGDAIRNVRPTVNGDRVYSWELLSLDECRRAFERRAKVTDCKWPGDEGDKTESFGRGGVVD